MNFRQLAVLVLFLGVFLPISPAASAQTLADSVKAQAEAVQRVFQYQARGRDGIWLDPRPELRRDSLKAISVRELVASGLQYYDSPGVPPPGVLLMSLGGFREGEGGTQVSATLRSFGSRAGFLNAYTYEHSFPVTCNEEGCVLGAQHQIAHGDGHLPAKCWDDFFSRSEQDRRECRWQPRWAERNVVAPDAVLPSGPMNESASEAE